MAIITTGVANSTIGPAQYADMAQALAPRFLVDGPMDLKTTSGSTYVAVQPGAAVIAGVRVRVQGVQTVPVPMIGGKAAHYALVLRVDWAKGANDAATFEMIENPEVNTSTTPDLKKINRIPGVMYDAVIFTRIKRSGDFGVLSADMRLWGGDGGPLRIFPTGMVNGDLSLLDARVGTMISTDNGAATKRLDDDGVWRDVGTALNPWKQWTPTMRYYGNGTPNGVSGGTIAGHGGASSVSARYRVVDGMLDGYVYIRAAPTGATWGDGPITIDLPMKCASWQTDTWSMGHLFTTGYGGDGSFDWHMEALIQAGWTRAMLWTNPRIDDSRLNPFKVQTPNQGPGTGVPFINGGYPVGTITLHLSYPVTE